MISRISLYLLLTVATVSAGEHKSKIATQMAVTTMKAVEGTAKVPRSKCTKCKGTGKVQGGDGVVKVWMECPNCYAETQATMPVSVPCEQQANVRRPEPPPVEQDLTKPEQEPSKPDPSDSEIEPEHSDTLVPAPRETRWIMLTAEWCGPCRAEKGDLIPKSDGAPFERLLAVDWSIGVGPENHIQMIDVDKYPGVVKQYRPTSYPTFILLKDNKVVTRVNGFMSARALSTGYNNAISPRMTPEQLRQWCRSYVGPPHFVAAPTTFRQHLMDPQATAHEGGPFESWQLVGLTNKELAFVHGGQHEGYLTPFGPTSKKVEPDPHRGTYPNDLFR